MDQALYLGSLYLYFVESKYVQQKVFFTQIVYPKQLELKLEHQEEHAKFLGLGITIEGNIFVYKLLYKWDKFPFFIV